jgi:hypothetical protein
VNARFRILAVTLVTLSALNVGVLVGVSNSIRAADAVLFLLAIVGLSYGPRTVVVPVFVACLFAMTLALIPAQSIGHVVFASRIGIVPLALIGVQVAVTGSPCTARRVVVGLSFGSLILSALALYQWYLGVRTTGVAVELESLRSAISRFSPIDNLEPTSAGSTFLSSGTFDNSNEYGGVQAIIVLSLVASKWRVQAFTKARWLVLFAISVGLIATLVSGSRSAMLAIGVYFAFQLVRRIPSEARLTAGALIATSVAAVFLVLNSADQTQSGDPVSGFFPRLASIVRIGTDPTAEGRVATYVEALRMIGDQPFGRDGPSALNQIGAAHSSVLLAAVILGVIPGLAILIAVVVVLRQPNASGLRFDIGLVVAIAMIFALEDRVRSPSAVAMAVVGLGLSLRGLAEDAGGFE